MKKAIPIHWYKQFWPWFLIALPGAAVIASMITLNIAFKYADQPVSGNYEKHGLTVLHKAAPAPAEITPNSSAPPQ